jgi:hypothetical protein
VNDKNEIEIISKVIFPPEAEFGQGSIQIAFDIKVHAKDEWFLENTFVERYNEMCKKIAEVLQDHIGVHL